MKTDNNENTESFFLQSPDTQ